MTPGVSRNAPGALTLPLVSVGVVVTVFAGLVLAVRQITGGTFEYPLDDPYIHLALAEQIARGGYGINPGELSSPGSSPAYPLLLTPFAGQPVQRYLPAVWNLAGLVAAAWLWGRLLFEAGYGRPGWRWLGIAVAGLFPVALQMPQVAFLGMEHALHTAGALAVVLGLFRHLSDSPRGGIGLVVAGAFVGSCFRFEAMALGVLAGLALVLTGRRGAGALTVAAALLPVVAFFGVLLALGLEPMPSSVQVKLSGYDFIEGGPVLRRWLMLVLNIMYPSGTMLAAIAITSLVLPLALPHLRQDRLMLFAVVLFAAAFAHLALGRMGWLNRYEHYALVVAAAGLLALLPRVVQVKRPGVTQDARPGVTVPVIAGLMLGGAVWAYSTGTMNLLVIGSRTILAQQGEMARFAQDYLNTAVAVNDIGRVAWTNPNPVLDLWGLASVEAREMRLNDPQPGWVGELAAAHDVPVAMVYDHWFKDGLGTDWVRVGQLDLVISRGFIGGESVAFYATTPEHVAPLRTALAEFVPTLSPDVVFRWEEGMAP